MTENGQDRRDIKPNPRIRAVTKPLRRFSESTLLLLPVLVFFLIETAAVFVFDWPLLALPLNQPLSELAVLIGAFLLFGAPIAMIALFALREKIREQDIPNYP